MPYSAKAPEDARDMNYGSMNRAQKLVAREIVLTHYFSRWDNSPSDIAFLTGYKKSAVENIIYKTIVPGVNLVELKKQYKK